MKSLLVKVLKPQVPAWQEPAREEGLRPHWHPDAAFGGLGHPIR